MSFTCYAGKANFKEKRNLQQHITARHASTKEYSCNQIATLWTEDDKFNLFHQQTVLRGYLHTYQLKSKEPSNDAFIFLDQAAAIVETLCRGFSDWSGLKLFLSLSISFMKMPAGNASDDIDAHFNSPQHVLLRHEEVLDKFKLASSQILVRVEEFVKNGSGWVLKMIRHLDIHITRYQPLRGSSFKVIPEPLARKKAIVNIQNNDEMCFMWSVLASLYPTQDNANRVAKYIQYAPELDFSGIQFPVSFKSIPAFERQNSISVNVFGYEEHEVVPLFISDTHHDRVVDLMFYHGHYSLIRHLDRLLSTQRKCRKKLYFCRRCLIPQYSDEKLSTHTKHCMNNKPATVKLPKNTIMSFKNTNRMLRAPYVIYGDFECILEPIATCQPSPSTSFTQTYQRHVPCSFGLVDVFKCCSAPAVVGLPHIYRGKDAVHQCLVKVIEMCEGHQVRLSSPQTIDMSDEDWRHFRTSQKCMICEKTLSVSDKVKDHCHLCGKFRGAAHAKCNIDYRITRDVTVMFHNLRKYDGVLIMDQMAIICNQRGLEVECLPKGIEDYISFSIKKRSQTKRSARGTCNVAETKKMALAH